MKTRTRITAMGASVLIAGGLAVVPASSALANAPCSSATPAVPNTTSAPNAPAPGNPTSGTSGGACDVAGQIIVASTLALEVGVSSFSITSPINTPTYTVCIVDNNAGSTGYYLDQAITSGFHGVAAPGNTLRASDLVADTARNQIVSGQSGTENQLNVAMTPSGTAGLSTALLMLNVPGLSTGTNYSGNNSGGAVADCPVINGNQPDTFDFEGWTEQSNTAQLLTTGVTAPGDTYNGVVTEALWG